MGKARQGFRKYCNIRRDTWGGESKTKHTKEASVRGIREWGTSAENRSRPRKTRERPNPLELLSTFTVCCLILSERRLQPRMGLLDLGLS